MINNNMTQGIANILTGKSTTIPGYLALGSTTGILTSADLVTSGEFERDALSSTSTASNIAKFTYLKLASMASSSYVNVAGLWDSSSGGNLWANMLIPSVLQTTNFDMDLEIWVQFIGV